MGNREIDVRDTQPLPSAWDKVIAMIEAGERPSNSDLANALASGERTPKLVSDWFVEGFVHPSDAPGLSSRNGRYHG